MNLHCYFWRLIWSFLSHAPLCPRLWCGYPKIAQFSPLLSPSTHSAPFASQFGIGSRRRECRELDLRRQIRPRCTPKSNQRLLRLHTDQTKSKLCVLNDSNILTSYISGDNIISSDRFLCILYIWFQVEVPKLE